MGLQHRAEPGTSCRATIRAIAAWTVALCSCASLNDEAVCAQPNGATHTGFPYVAYVTHDGADVLSGPGADHYSTMQLAAGYAVEVYRHDGDQWCAIRPPEGSYSLVKRQAVRIAENNIGEITKREVPSCVSSVSGQRQNAVQVLLDQGELVELLPSSLDDAGYLRIAPPSGEFRWISAAQLSRMPPIEGGAAPLITSDRWTAQSQRSSLVQGKGAAQPDYHGRLNFRKVEVVGFEDADPPVVPIDAVAQPVELTVEGAPASSNGFRHLLTSTAGAGTWSADRQELASADNINVVDGSPAAIKLTQQSSTPAPSTQQTQTPVATTRPPQHQLVTEQTGQPGPPRLRLPSSSPSEANVQFADLQLQLSQLIVQPPSTWNLSGLRAEAERLLAESEDEVKQQQLQETLDRIAAFERAQIRYTRPWALGGQTVQDLAAVQPTPLVADSDTAVQASPNEGLAMTGGLAGTIRERVQADLDVRTESSPGSQMTAVPDNRDLTAESTADITPTAVDPFVGATAGDTTARYDAVGTLKPVVSKRKQAPRFAVVDDDGQVIAFVTGSTDVNLQRFVGQRIGVHGSRGFMPAYRRPHVTANRVTPLEESIVR